MENIEKSEVVVASILAKVLQYGLQNANLEFDDLNLENEYASFFPTSIDWLVSEGLIRVESHQTMLNGSSTALGITLTSRGFAAMGQKINGTAGEIVVSDVVKQVAESTAGYTGLGDFIGGILGGFTKSMSS